MEQMQTTNITNTPNTPNTKTNLQKSMELLRRKRYLEATKEAAREQLACYRCEAAGEAFPPAPPEREEDCKKRLARAEEELTLIRCAYAVLTPYQRDLLDTFFVESEKYCADRLCEKYYKERSALYRDRRKALAAFTLAAFGEVG